MRKIKGRSNYRLSGFIKGKQVNKNGKELFNKAIKKQLLKNNLTQNSFKHYVLIFSMLPSKKGDSLSSKETNKQNFDFRVSGKKELLPDFSKTSKVRNIYESNFQNEQTVITSLILSKDQKTGKKFQTKNPT